MRSLNVWQAMTRSGYLLSAWPWRAAGYLLSSAPVGIVALLAIVLGAAVGSALAVVLIGLPLLALLALSGLPVAALERRRLRMVDRRPAPTPHRVPDEPGLLAWGRTRFREQATWRELGYTLAFATVLWPFDLLAFAMALVVPLGLVATPVLMATVGDGEEAPVLKMWTATSWPEAFAVAVVGLLLFGVSGYVMGAVAVARAELARLLLVPETDLGEKVTELVRSRVRLVDAFEAERRRIERDLHDGAQQRIVALTMTLGLARLDAPPGALADQLAKAHDEAGKALAELRELIQGIHPKVLADFGVGAAVVDAADRSVIPVDVSVDLSRRLPEAVEAAAYFVVCEALANVAKHSGAQRAEVTGRHADGWLVFEVRDDGCGGADAQRGSGLTGLADRVSVLDGRLTLSSPAGGPTLLRVEIPCEPTELSV
ncbi:MULTISPECIES: sensor domain-containing protein [unclassified Streptomyces]|uniref:sensor histidine kinase n=1 Tax=unclassified Streptomyces TaxID=2593676 RepID=UPI002ED190F4|nr:sensor domain-containing protein [Streptomyces sp. NBC_00891]WSY06296.1 sensor domain-containing protein [Streptomyces sp. NBC_00890]WSZ07921.1 sensor domain-containing protein [Streptomyces sp. NBC_00869]WSZ24580.1 sensor domain-containing protein [Streptomyces sp. NBC_00870]